MKTIVLMICIALLITVTAAEPAKPELPKTPRGFDDGRKAALKEAVESNNDGDRLLKDVWEDADLTEMAEFVHAHLNAAERGLLDKHLELEGKLTAAPSLPDVIKLFSDKKLNARAIVKVLAKMHRKSKYTLLDSVTWLYNRDVNFHVINLAFSGERIDAIRLRAEFRQLIKKSKEPNRLFKPGLWEFNLKDGREEKGGHYDGAQLVEVLLELGWDAEQFADALGKKNVNDLSQVQRDLIKWKDPVLLWDVLDASVSERELLDFALDYFKKQDRVGDGTQKIAELSLRRFHTVDRWFRTGGEGVVGVYSGPWPDAKGTPKPPKVSSLEIGEGADGFAEALGDPLWNHFSKDGESLTLVFYEDGSARAMLSQPQRKAHTFNRNTPMGGKSSHKLLYEGRVSLKGESALLYLVFGKGIDAEPSEIELAKLVLAGDGALLSASVDDGINLTPVLLRRVNRLIDQK